MRVAKTSGRKNKKSSKAAGKRSDTPSPSSAFRIGGTSRAYESAGAAAASLVTSLLNSFVRDVISAGLTSVAAALLATKVQKDKGGEAALPVTRARAVISVARGSRRKPASPSSGTLTEEAAVPNVSLARAAQAISSPAKKKPSDVGVKRVQRQKSGTVESPPVPSTLAGANTVVPTAVLSAAKQNDRAAPKAKRKRSAPSPVVRTRRKRSDAGVKRVPAQKIERAATVVEPAALNEPNTSALVAAPSGTRPKRRATPKTARNGSAVSAGTRTRKKRSDAAVKAVSAGNGNLDPHALPSEQPDTPTPGTGSESNS